MTWRAREAADSSCRGRTGAGDTDVGKVLVVPDGGVMSNP